MKWRVKVSSPNNLFRMLPDSPTKFVVTGGFVWAQTEEEAIEAADRAGLTTMFGFKFEGVEVADRAPVSH